LYNVYNGVEKKDPKMNIKIVKDNFFSTKKWFVVADGVKANTVGFTTKKAAVQLCDEIVPDWHHIPKWPTDTSGKVI